MENAAASVRLLTNAKLNLFLRVLGRRPDGYHELESIFQSIDLCDDLELDATEDGAVDVRMSFDEGVTGTAPERSDDLMFRAAQLLLDRDGTNLGVRIELVKRIPIGGGLGGGSANAAGVLVGLNELWGLDLDRTELQKTAAVLGSDVPFCLQGGTALAMDRGEELTSLPALQPMHLVLGLSFDPLSTADVYAKWDEVGETGEPSSSAMALALGAGDVESVAGLLHNDLEPPAFSLRPELVGKKQAMLDAGALGAGLSGSGPTLFAVVRDSQQALQVATRVRAHFDRVVVAVTASRGVERSD